MIEYFEIKKKKKKKKNVFSIYIEFYNKRMS